MYATVLRDESEAEGLTVVWGGGGEGEDNARGNYCKLSPAL